MRHPFLGAVIGQRQHGAAVRHELLGLLGNRGKRIAGHDQRIDEVFQSRIDIAAGQLIGRYVDTTLENFINSLVVSCYSFTAIAQQAEKLMPDGGAMLTLTYYGAEKWMPHYNVMGVAKAALESSVRYLAADLGERGIRVNAISAGPIK